MPPSANAVPVLSRSVLHFVLPGLGVVRRDVLWGIDGCFCHNPITFLLLSIGISAVNPIATSASYRVLA